MGQSRDPVWEVEAVFRGAALSLLDIMVKRGGMTALNFRKSLWPQCGDGVTEQRNRLQEQEKGYGRYQAASDKWGWPSGEKRTESLG